MEIIPLMRVAGEKLLAHYLKKATDQGVEAQSVLIDEIPGRICDHVTGQAMRAKADLIVVGSHGRRGVGRIKELELHARVQEAGNGPA